MKNKALIFEIFVLHTSQHEKFTMCKITFLAIKFNSFRSYITERSLTDFIVQIKTTFKKWSNKTRKIKNLW